MLMECEVSVRCVCCVLCAGTQVQTFLVDSRGKGRVDGVLGFFTILNLRKGNWRWCFWHVSTHRSSLSTNYYTANSRQNCPYSNEINMMCLDDLDNGSFVFPHELSFKKNSKWMCYLTLRPLGSLYLESIGSRTQRQTHPETDSTRTKPKKIPPSLVDTWQKHGNMESWRRDGLSGMKWRMCMDKHASKVKFSQTSKFNKREINARWSDGVNEGLECTIAITDLKLLETDESWCEHHITT